MLEVDDQLVLSIARDGEPEEMAADMLQLAIPPAEQLGDGALKGSNVKDYCLDILEKQLCLTGLRSQKNSALLLRAILRKCNLRKDCVMEAVAAAQEAAHILGEEPINFAR